MGCWMVVEGLDEVFSTAPRVSEVAQRRDDLT
jgi:hypothetical protein